MSESYFTYSNNARLSSQQANLDGFFSKTLYNLNCQLNSSDLSNEAKMDLQRTMAGSLPIMKNTQSGPISILTRRTWQDIRNDQKRYVLLWFLFKGGLSVKQNNYNEIISEDSFMLTCSSRPYLIETIANENNEHESLTIALPLHVANTYFIDAEQLGGCKLPVNKGDALLAKQTCLMLYELADEMSEKVSTSFLNTCLEACSSAIQSEYARQKEKHDIKQIRLRAIIDFVNNNLTTPRLTSNRVAEACNISSRYLHLLLKENGILFHDFVWKKRLDLAHQWLSKKDQKSIPIATVANNAGFKSISHFSRSFKAEYGYTPSELRNKSSKN